MSNDAVGDSSMTGGARRHSGFSLVEVVVAAGALALLLGALLSLHDRLMRHYLLSQDRAAAQQNARLAFTRLTEELRMAGLNVNPDGDPGSGDEAIEGMWREAVTLRADFDLADAAAAADPEALLGGPAARHKTVSTGNDEVVTWVLASASGGVTQTISFTADLLSTPRDGGADELLIDGVDLSGSAPPYTLYRIHPDPSGSGLVRQPVADQIRSLSFRYFDAAGSEIPPAGGGEDPNNRALRAAVARIAVELVGLTEHDDPGWEQAAESAPAVGRRRRVILRTEVVLRNRGLTGRPDMDTEDPASPAGMSALSPVFRPPLLAVGRLDAAG